MEFRIVNQHSEGIMVEVVMVGGCSNPKEGPIDKIGLMFRRVHDGHFLQPIVMTLEEASRLATYVQKAVHYARGGQESN